MADEEKIDSLIVKGNNFILVGPRDTQKNSIANSLLSDLDWPPFNFHEPYNNDGTVRITLAENGQYFVGVCLGIGDDITDIKSPSLEIRRTSNDITDVKSPSLESPGTSNDSSSGKSTSLESLGTSNDSSSGKSTSLKYQDLTDDSVREKLVEKMVKFLLCVRFNNRNYSPDFLKSCKHFLCVFGLDAVKSIILITIQTDNVLSAELFTRKLYETEGYKLLKEINNNNDIPFVIWDNNNNNKNSYQFRGLRDQASKLSGLEISPEKWNEFKGRSFNLKGIMRKEERNFILIGPNSDQSVNSSDRVSEKDTIRVDLTTFDELTFVKCSVWNKESTNIIYDSFSSQLLEQIDKKLCDEKIANKKFKFLLCTKIDPNSKFLDFCFKLVEKFEKTDLIECLIVIPQEKYFQNESLDLYVKKAYECVEKLKKEDMQPFVLWDNHSGWFENQFDVLCDQTSQLNSVRNPPVGKKERDKSPSNLEMMIIFAEKSETDGTRVAFRKLFGVEFQPGTCSYGQVYVDQEPITLFYLNLSEKKHNPTYAEQLKQLPSDREISLVICFEYCNPRVQEIDQNIRELRDMFDVDKLRFVFYTGEDRVLEKIKLVMQMGEFLECRFIDNLETRVFLLDKDIRLSQLLEDNHMRSKMIRIFNNLEGSKKESQKEPKKEPQKETQNDPQKEPGLLNKITNFFLQN